MPPSREGLVDARIDLLSDQAGARYSWEAKTERIVFAVAAAAVVAHLVDHLIVGVVMDLQFDVVLAFGALPVVAAVAYPWLPRKLQAVGSIALGLGGGRRLRLHATPRSATAPMRPTTRGWGDRCRWAVVGVGVAAALAVGGGSSAHPRERPGWPERLVRVSSNSPGI